VDASRGQESSSAVPEDDFVLTNYLRRIIRTDSEITQSSRETYYHNIRNHIDGTELGATDIHVITPGMIRDFWTLGPAEKGIGVRRNVLMVLSKGFTNAVLDGELAENPLKRARIKSPSKNRREEVIPMTVDQVERVAECALSRNVGIAILTMAYAGLRAGEVCGLRIQDVNFTRCTLSIRTQITYTPGKGKAWAPLKTDASRRTVTIPRSLAEELESFVRSEPPSEDGRIFHGANGEMWAHQMVHHGVFHAAKVAEIAGVFPHRFRHTAVSLLIDDGASPKAIQAFCGHSKIGVTLDTYGHLFDYGGVALAESMERRRERHRAEKAAPVRQ
jgi:integrase